MVSRAEAVSIIGVDAAAVEVEAQVVGALRRFSIVGLPDGVLKESKDRVRCALENSGFEFPHGEVIVNLAPAALPKAGSSFDLAIAMSILAAAGALPVTCLEGVLFHGELALDGSLRSVRGEIAAASFAKENSLALCMTESYAEETAVLSAATVFGFKSLSQLVAHFRRDELQERKSISAKRKTKRVLRSPQFSEVCGQEDPKRALEIAAAGGHNVLMCGPPGSGKTMLARSLANILPPLSLEEALEVARIYTSRDGSDGLRKDGFEAARPFRAPHHTLSEVALIGGGKTPQPGEISLAHRGVLFLDEFTELRRASIEALRIPLEQKVVEICRASYRVKLPADFMLVAAMNPCPCGKAGSGEQRECRCLPTEIRKYQSRISGPILDRFDLQVWVPAVATQDIVEQKAQADEDLCLLEKVSAARSLQHARTAVCKASLNSNLNQAELREYCSLSVECRELMRKAISQLSLSARSYMRTLRVSRTIADLEGVGVLLPKHLVEALHYRQRFSAK